MSLRSTCLVVLAAMLAALAATAPAGAELTQPQKFFTERLLADSQTSKSVKDLLREGGGFVDRSVVFRDLTRDKRDDAVVRVHSGGAAGVVAVYVFSTDTRRSGTGLRAVFRSQRLLRASTQISKGVMSYRTANYAAADELCCPSQLIETSLRWISKTRSFRIGQRRTIAQPPQAGVPAAPEPTPTPAPPS
ncbi:MAG: hypothetical protein ACXW08_08645 [Solirubrobacteraceae bacterium]